jgi:hypothetical protein
MTRLIGVGRPRSEICAFFVMSRRSGEFLTNFLTFLRNAIPPEIRAASVPLPDDPPSCKDVPISPTNRLNSKNELWPRLATVNLSPTRSGKQRNCESGKGSAFGIQNRSYSSRTREVFLQGDNFFLGSWTAGTKPNCRKVVVIAHELCPRNDAHVLPLPDHGTTAMPLTSALANCARSNFRTALAKADNARYRSPGISTSANCS